MKTPVLFKKPMPLEQSDRLRKIIAKAKKPTLRDEFKELTRRFWLNPLGWGLTWLILVTTLAGITKYFSL